MIQITNRFFINADTNCYKLQEKALIQDEQSKNYGKEVFKDIGYYTSFEQCIDAIIKTLGREYISKDQINTLNDLKQFIKEQTIDIKKGLNDVKPL